MSRDRISVKIARHLNLTEKTNLNAAALHNVSEIGREKKKEANEKRPKFYKIEKGIAIK